MEIEVNDNYNNHSTYRYYRMTDETTTIEIKKTTKAKLDKRGKKCDSYNDIIERLLQ